MNYVRLTTKEGQVNTNTNTDTSPQPFFVVSLLLLTISGLLLTVNPTMLKFPQPLFAVSRSSHFRRRGWQNTVLWA